MTTLAEELQKVILLWLSLVTMTTVMMEPHAEVSWLHTHNGNYDTHAVFLD